MAGHDEQGEEVVTLDDLSDEDRDEVLRVLEGLSGPRFDGAVYRIDAEGEYVIDPFLFVDEAEAVEHVLAQEDEPGVLVVVAGNQLFFSHDIVNAARAQHGLPPVTPEEDE